MGHLIMRRSFLKCQSEVLKEPNTNARQFTLNISEQSKTLLPSNLDNILCFIRQSQERKCNDKLKPKQEDR